MRSMVAGHYKLVSERQSVDTAVIATRDHQSICIAVGVNWKRMWKNTSACSQNDLHSIEKRSGASVLCHCDEFGVNQRMIHNTVQYVLKQ